MFRNVLCNDVFTSDKTRQLRELFIEAMYSVGEEDNYSREEINYSTPQQLLDGLTYFSFKLQLVPPLPRRSEEVTPMLSDEFRQLPPLTDHMERAIRIYPFEQRAVPNTATIKAYLEKDSLKEANKKCSTLVDKLNELNWQYNMLAREFGNIEDQRKIKYNTAFIARDNLNSCIQFISVLNEEIKRITLLLKQFKRSIGFDGLIMTMEAKTIYEMKQVDALFEKGMKL